MSPLYYISYRIPLPLCLFVKNSLYLFNIIEKKHLKGIIKDVFCTKSVSALHFAHVSFFPCGRTQKFCSGIVTHIVVGNLCKNVR